MSALHKLGIRVLALLIGLCTLTAGLAHAQLKSSQADKAVHDAKQGFEDAGSMPWYDSEVDGLKPMHFRTWPNWDWLRDWLPEFPKFSLRWLIWTALTVLVATLLWMIWKYARVRTGGIPTYGGAEPKLLRADHVEALPFLAERPRSDLLGEARRHYEQGNYAEAIIYLYSYELVEADKHSLVRLSRGKTNREYLRESARIKGVKNLLEQTMVAFEDVFFGKHLLDRAGFEACWNQLPEFKALLAQATP